MTTNASDRIQFDQEAADEKQIDGYKSDLPKYELFAEVLNVVLSRAVKKLGILAIVRTRAKGVPNFAEKMIRKRDQYPDAVNQLTDLCGARIIVDFRMRSSPYADLSEDILSSTKRRICWNVSPWLNSATGRFILLFP